MGKMRKLHLPYMSRRTVNFSFGYVYCSSSDSTTPTLCLADAFSDSTDAGIELFGDCQAKFPQSGGILLPRISSKKKLLTEPSRNQADGPAPGLDFHRAALQMASVREPRLHH